MSYSAVEASKFICGNIVHVVLGSTVVATFAHITSSDTAEKFKVSLFM